MASRPITTIAIFFIALNLFASVLQAQGVFLALGVGDVSQDCPDNPTQEQINRIADCKVSDLSNNDVEAGTQSEGALFGMYNVLAKQVSGIYDVIFPGLAMLNRAGVPAWITRDILGNLMSVMISIAIISLLRGWDL